MLNQFSFSIKKYSDFKKLLSLLLNLVHEVNPKVSLSHLFPSLNLKLKYVKIYRT